jgi:putative salt-induced outer membrane protein YdiY
MLLLHLLTLVAFTGDTNHPATANANPVPKVPAMKFAGDAGFVSTGGNTSVQTLNLGDKISARIDQVTLTEQFGLVNGRSKGETIASSWAGTLRTDVAIDRDIGLYASVTYERNTFAGLASRVGTVTGVSAQVIKTKTDKLVIEGGVSLTTQDGTAAGTVDPDFLGGRAATAFSHQIGPRASLSQSIEVLPNFREGADLRVNTETDLLAPFTHNAAIKLSYVIHYDGIPEPGYLSTDRLFTSGIQVTL